MKTEINNNINEISNNTAVRHCILHIPNLGDQTSPDFECFGGNKMFDTFQICNHLIDHSTFRKTSFVSSKFVISDSLTEFQFFRNHDILLKFGAISCVQNSKVNFIEIEGQNLNFATSLNIYVVTDSFIQKIRMLDKIDKTQDSIKEVHRLFQDILSFHSIKLSDTVLESVAKLDFSLAVLTAFLTATIPFKNQLSNRKFVFAKAKDLAVAQLGEDKLNKSLFNSLL
ncbi:hypothetical protein [Flavobacterium sp.]|uniref:hypothetical protein n=1 Tax=Flavobacterium sp. TaxID=239 RepID=UPI0040339A7D